MEQNDKPGCDNDHAAYFTEYGFEIGASSSENGFEIIPRYYFKAFEKNAGKEQDTHQQYDSKGSQPDAEHKKQARAFLYMDLPELVERILNNIEQCSGNKKKKKKPDDDHKPAVAKPTDAS